MDGFNRIVSFVLGLVVVIVVIAVISGRLKLGPQNKTTKISPTVVKKVTPTPTKAPTYKGGNTGGTGGTTTQPSTASVASIPKTGAETVMIPLSFAALFGGMFLKRKSS